MNRVTPAVRIAILLLALLTSVGCGISGKALRATMEAKIRPAVATEARQTAEIETGTAVAAALTEVVSMQEVAFKTVHGRYITAGQGEGDDGSDLEQQTELGPCGWFTLQHRANGKVALVTCHDRYVTAPETGTESQDWLLGQEPELSDCGQFDLYELGSGRVALKTCAGYFVTPGDDSWPGVEWKVVAETDYLDQWEELRMVQDPFIIADFDSCSDEGGRIVTMVPPGNSLELFFMPEEGRGCVARLAYEVADWCSLLIWLRGTDLTPYGQLTFDAKGEPGAIPDGVKIELKRAGASEAAILPISGITTDWQTVILDLADLEGELTSFTDMEELLLTLGVKESGPEGVLYLDNIALLPERGSQ